MEVLDALRSTATRSNNPDNQYGWGIINALNAINLIPLPVELTSFSANYLDGVVKLKWVTATETNNYGFEVERKTDNSNYESIGFVQGGGSSTNRLTYNFVDNNLLSNKYYYRLKQVDFDGSVEYSNEVQVEIDGLNDFKLYQNYPNPFNPSTVISWQSPIGSNQMLKIYDVLGNEVAILVDEFKDAGYYETEFNASELPSGLYFYQLRSNYFNKTKKMMLIK